MLLHAYYKTLESYLMNKLSEVKFKDKITIIRKTEAGSVLGPVLCFIYISDLQTSDNTTAATFADVEQS
jgi:hypothetical protein